MAYVFTGIILLIGVYIIADAWRDIKRLLK